MSTFTEQIEQFYDETRLSPQEEMRNQILFYFIEACVRDLGSINNLSLKLLQTGSNIFGTDCSLFSDLDLTVISPSNDIKNPYITYNEEKKKQFLQKLATIIHQNQDSSISIQKILNARYPIIRLFYIPSKFLIDISFGNILSIKCIDFICHQIQYFESIGISAKQFIVFIKYWSKQRGINNSPQHYLNSFGYQLLIIRFIQIYIKNNEYKSFTKLIFDFFKFYGLNYDPMMHSISVISKNNDTIYDKKRFTNNWMEIYGPNNQNSARNVKEKQCKHIMDEFKRAYNLCCIFQKNQQKFDENPFEKYEDSLFQKLSEEIVVDQIIDTNYYHQIAILTEKDEIIPIDVNDEWQNASDIMLRQNIEYIFEALVNNDHNPQQMMDAYTECIEVLGIKSEESQNRVYMEWYNLCNDLKMIGISENMQETDIETESKDAFDSQSSIRNDYENMMNDLKVSMKSNDKIGILQNQYKIGRYKFEFWLNDILNMKQYLSLFEENEYDDITMIEWFDRDLIENEIGIRNEIHIELIMNAVNEYKKKLNEFKQYMVNNDILRNYEKKLKEHCIVTVNDLICDIKNRNHIQNILNVNNAEEINVILKRIQQIQNTIV